MGSASYVEYFLMLHLLTALWDTDLEHTIIVHVLQGEREALCEHSVYPALHDGGHTEPVEWELQEETTVTSL